MNEPIRAPRDVLKDLYAVVAARRGNYDSMMWQVPGIALASQAFLLTSALDPAGSRALRVVAAALAAAVAGATAQLMTKHRDMEVADSLMLQSIERQLGVQLGADDVAVTPHAAGRARYRALGRSLSPLGHYSSFAVWRGLLGLFCVVSLALAILVAAGVL